MIHVLCLGTDKKSQEQRDKKIAELKAKFLLSPEALQLDLEELDAKRLSAERLKIALVSLPGQAVRRILIIRQADKLPKDCAELLEKHLRENEAEGPVLVLEAEEWPLKSDFRKFVHANFQRTGAIQKQASAFDMMDALDDQVRALRILNTLFDDGEAPEVVLGGMVWAWSNKMKARVRGDNYKKGLLVLQEADMCLKRSKFPERGYALEVAVVKLSSLLRA